MSDREQFAATDDAQVSTAGSDQVSGRDQENGDALGVAMTSAGSLLEQSGALADSAASEAAEPTTAAWPDKAHGEDFTAESQETADAKGAPGPPSGPAPWLLGMLQTVSLLVAAVAGGYAVLLALGGRPALLWPLSPALFQPVALMLGGVLLLGVLGTLLTGLAASRARDRYQKSEAVIAGLAALDLAGRQNWTGDWLSSCPEVETFLTSVRYAYDRQQSKLARQIGLEGELFRLEKSIAQRTRQDLDARFDNPAAASLAETVCCLFDEGAQAQQKLEASERKLAAAGPDLCQTIQESAVWNNSALDRLNVQVAALVRQIPALEKVALTAQQADRQNATAETAKALDSLKQKLAQLPATENGETLDGLARSVKTLVDKGGKLAIHGASEVARLGAKGKSLLTLTEELQHLVTEFRAAATQMEAFAKNQQRTTKVVGEIRGQVAALASASGSDEHSSPNWQELSGLAQKTLAALRQGGSELSSLPSGFNDQSDRLSRLGQTCAELTGTPFVCDKSAAGPAVDLEVERFNPFASAGSDGSPALSAPAPSPLMSPAATGAATQPPLPQAGDRVYDLSEFDAVALDNQEVTAGAEVEERIYELAEFGAVALS